MGTTEVLIILIIVGAFYGIYRFTKNSPSPQNKLDGPAGVGGWLLLLIIVLMVLGPLMGAGRIIENFMMAESNYPNLKGIDTWQVYKSATWWSYLVVVCLSIYAGFELAKGRKSSVVKKVTILLWIVGPVASIVMGLLLPFFVFGEIRMNSQFVGSLFGSVIFAAIWTAYLLRSHRVKSTYYKNA